MTQLHSPPRNQGAALVVVLSFLVIVVVLTLAISATAVLERRSSNVAGTVMQTDLLVRTVENLVQSQIRTATTLSISNSWSSQPGMIRNYDISGNLSAAYKLYSAANQTLSSAADLQTELTRESALATNLAFTNSPALYEDLNRPLIFATSGQTNITYPIADPRALGMVDGFFWNASASSTGTNTTPLTSSYTLNGTATNLPVLPMPVQWIYVLKDGTLVAPDPTAPGTSRKVTLSGASKANPVVGRISYWTDDETCKLNINTAADGASRNDFWDTPRTGTYSQYAPISSHVEGTYAAYQPNANEFQRYLGHPATTSLRPVFANYLASPTYNPSSSSSFANANYPTSSPYNATNDINMRRALVQMSPRYRELNDSGTPVGSQGGTVSGNLFNMTNKISRLYNSVDELNYATNRATTTAVPSTTNPIFTLPTSVLEQTRFFTTASSRAPEVNLFNLPRVSIWPVSNFINPSIANLDRRSVSDQLNIFCSSLTTNAPWNFQVASNSNVYFFTRNNPTDDTDLNKSANRRFELYNYLYTLMSRPIPGFGGSSGTDSFASKYGTDSATGDMPQILTEVADYIRCINAGQSVGVNNAFAVTNNAGMAQVTPLRPNFNTTRGFGRIATLSEVALIFVGQQAGTNSPASLNTNYNCAPLFAPQLTTVAQGPMHYLPRLQVRVTGLTNLVVTPNINDPTRTNRLFTNASDFCRDFNMEQTYSVSTGIAAGFRGATAGNWGQFTGPAFAPTNSTNSTTTLWVGNNTYSNGTPTNNLPTSYQFSVTQTGPITVIVSDSANTNLGVQTFNIFFPSFTNTYPLPLGTNVTGNNATGAFDSSFLSNFPNQTYQQRVNNRNHHKYGHMVLPHDNDVVKSLVPMGPTVTNGWSINGDLRMIATLTNISTNVFLPNLNYFRTNRNMGGNSHSFVNAVQGFYGLGTLHSWNHTLNAFTSSTGAGRFGRLAFSSSTNFFNQSSYANDGREFRFGPLAIVPMISYPYTGITNLMTVTNLMNGVSNALGRPGDWDTGMSWYSDGPWINKPDEGDMQSYTSWAGANMPYYTPGNVRRTITNAALFSPNRQVASPVMFGSLPTGVKSGRPWETLLFCPNPAALTNDVCGRFPFLNSTSTNFHRGFGNPPDYLLLDLFWMPVVEPYAISDPLSTAGKVNLNQNLIPFSTIRRESALRGVLAGTRIAAFPINFEPWHKGYNMINFPWGAYTNGVNFRYPLNLDKTMDEVNAYIGTNGAFKSATEICGIYLIPRQNIAGGVMWMNPLATTNITSGADITSRFWATNGLTGDNLRERPYNSIYPRLTTQSNVYQVHYTVQTLKKTPTSAANTWDEDKDVIRGEQRGSITMERYIDPRDSEFRLSTYDFATQAATSWPPPTLGRFYKFRTVNTRQFR